MFAFHESHNRPHTVPRNISQVPPLSTVITIFFLPTVPAIIIILSQKDFSVLARSYCNQSFPCWTSLHPSSLKSYSATHLRWIKKCKPGALKGWKNSLDLFYTLPLKGFVKKKISCSFNPLLLTVCRVFHNLSMARRLIFCG